MRPIMAGGKPLAVAMSVGLVLSSIFEGCEVEELRQLADAALYEAKGQAGIAYGMRAGSRKNPRTKQVLW